MRLTRRAILVGADPLVLAGLREHLTSQANLAVVDAVTTKPAPLATIQTHRPDLLIFLPDGFPGGGTDLARRCRKHFPTVRLLVLPARADLGLLAAYAGLGAAAYVLFEHLPDLIERVEVVETGGTILDHHLVDSLVELLRRPLGRAVLHALLADAAGKPTDSHPNGATPSIPTAQSMGPAGKSLHTDGDERRVAAPRRRAVVRLAGQGWTNKEIAARLDMQVSTVAEHLKRFRVEVDPVRRADLGRLLAEGRLGGDGDQRGAQER
ncbi:MAG: helix-turn-helix domain-containing protein [Chloroflexi bacterium]|nr:helix-turn-helix domain-containing protein [Chloroflexota bacterium]